MAQKCKKCKIVKSCKIWTGGQKYNLGALNESQGSLLSIKITFKHWRPSKKNAPIWSDLMWPMLFKRFLGYFRVPFVMHTLYTRFLKIYFIIALKYPFSAFKRTRIHIISIKRKKTAPFWKKNVRNLCEMTLLTCASLDGIPGSWPIGDHAQQINF